MDGLTARDAAFVAALRARVRGQVREAEPLARYSTYRIGGPATVLLPAVGEDVGAALTWPHEAGIPWFVVGLGSNILLPDEGLDALVLRMGKGLDQLRQDATAGRSEPDCPRRSPRGGQPPPAAPGSTSSSGSRERRAAGCT